MNIAKHLINNGIKFSNPSIDLTKEIDVKCEYVKSKGYIGIKNNQYIYKWFTYINNEKKILSGKGAYKIYIDQYCNICGKLIKKNDPINSKLWTWRNKHLQCKFNKICSKCKGKYNAIKGLNNAKKTNLKKYGVEWTGQREWHKGQMVDTKIKKYGKNYSKKFAEKAKQTYLKKYGVDHNGKVPEIRQKMIETWKNTINTKSPEEWKIWNERRLESYKKENSPGLFGRYNKQKNSKIAYDFLNELKSEYGFNYNIIEEEPIDKYYTDFFINNICCIEFFGDYWHANPKIYNEYDILKRPGAKNIFAKEVWEKDNIRLTEIYQTIQLPIIIVWESYFKYNKKLSITRTYGIIKEIETNGKTNDRFIINID
jgi:hypothetical protein